MNRGRWQEFFADEQGNVIAGASVSVFNQATGLPAIVYHEVAGGAAKQTPFQTDSRGFATFCAPSGRYRIVVAASGVETVINDVYIFPAEDREVGEAAFLNVGVGSDDVAAGNDPRLSDARPPTAHTHPISDVVGLQGELDGKEFSLTAGANITIDRTNPAAPVISSSGGGGGGGADWGQIGGDLSDQTDLQNALNEKADKTLVREKLTANRTYYVRTDGSDSNDGLADTSGGAFLTIQRAIDVAADLDLGIYNVTISVDARTADEAIVLKDPIGAGLVTISGAGSSSTIISPSSGNAISANQSKKIALSNLAIAANSPAGATCIAAQRESYVRVSTGVVFNAAGSNGSHIHVLTGSVVEITNAYGIAGSASRHFRMQSGSKIVCINRTVTITGSPAFSAFCFAEGSSYIQVSGNTYSGSATGQRYNVSKGAVIDTAGGGATYLPGDVEGTADNSTGGYYV